MDMPCTPIIYRAIGIGVRSISVDRASCRSANANSLLLCEATQRPGLRRQQCRANLVPGTAALLRQPFGVEEGPSRPHSVPSDADARAKRKSCDPCRLLRDLRQ